MECDKCKNQLCEVRTYIEDFEHYMEEYNVAVNVEVTECNREEKR